MAVVENLIKGLGSSLWIVAVIMIILVLFAVCFFVFFQRYPVRVIVFHKRASKDPVMKLDRAGRIKDGTGIEWYKLFHDKKQIEVPENKYIYSGKGFFNKSYLYLWEENNRYVPIEVEMGESIVLNPVNTSLEMKRIALDNLIKLRHDTTTWLDRNKGFVISMFVIMAVVVVIIVLATKGKDIFGGIKGVVSGFAPLAVLWRYKSGISK